MEKLSVAELGELRKEVDALIVARQDEAKASLKAELAVLAKEYGFDLDDIVGDGRGRGRKVAIKYRDPHNPENVWSGRGRMPRWMVAATKKRGVTRKDFAV
jgi:DNA-binding protein H-NS